MEKQHKTIKQLVKEQERGKCSFSRFLRSVLYKCGYSQCRYCVYFIPEGDGHQTVRESEILTNGKCKWSNIGGVSITKNKASKVHRCGGFVPVLYNIMGYQIKEDETKNILERRQNYFFSWATISIAIIAAVIACWQATETHGERVKAEKAFNEANKAKENILKIADTLFKISYVIADGSKCYGGVTDWHMRKIKEYQTSIRELLDKNLESEIEKDLSEIDKGMKGKT